jgi:hypothetical protein
VLGHGLDAVVEVTLDRQDNESMEAFEARVVADEAVQQCYRVSPGPDFMLVVRAPDMPGYLALAQRLFTQDANVRNVKAFFAVRRAKFDSRADPAATSSARLSATPYLGAFTGRFQFDRLACRPRATDSTPGSVSCVMVEPAPMVPPLPMRTGATSTQLLPTCTSSSITVRCLLAPS